MQSWFQKKEVKNHSCDKELRHQVHVWSWWVCRNQSVTWFCWSLKALLLQNYGSSPWFCQTHNESKQIFCL